MEAVLTVERLGEILHREDSLPAARIDAALEEQRVHGGRLGEILLREGHIGALPLYQAIARHFGLPFVNLKDIPADPALQNSGHMQDYIRLQFVPHTRENGVTVLATCDPSPALDSWARAHYEAFRFVITAPYDLYWHMDTHFSARLDEASRLALWHMAPHQSAREVLTGEQQSGLLILLVGVVVCLWFWPVSTVVTLLTVLNLFYFFTLLFKFQLFFCGRLYSTERQPRLHLPEAKDLPVYTVLVPLHDESQSLPRLLAALDALDYPKSKLDIKLIVERSDEKTIHALKGLRPRAGYELIYVPYSLPQTKPKACNYALHFARGEFVTIFDAEDAPEQLQLKKAVAAFRSAPEDVICLQARLNYYNRDKALLARLFSLEYALWFDYMIPGLHHLGIPIPLGGTSNHLRLSALRDLGDWDPFNVTEDADLGIRIALSGQKTAVLNSRTLEESPIHLSVWLRQRTRWVKGYMQTWLVHMRDPLGLMRRLPPAAFWGFQFFIFGPCLMFLTTPLLWGFSAAYLLGWLPRFSEISPLLLSLAAFNIGFGLLTHAYYAVFIILHQRWRRMGMAMLVFPFYWLLHSVAAYRAVWQLACAPHKWEKTPHGFTLGYATEEEKSPG